MLASIWLLPQKPQADALQAIIDSLSEAHGTVRFEPHLTVCGALRHLDALDAVADYVRRSGLLPLSVAKTGIASGVDSPFRAVFTEVVDTPALRRFRETLRDMTGAGELHPPHVSLLYSLNRENQRPMPRLDGDRLREIAEGCRDRVPAGELIFDRAVLKTAEGGWDNVKSWKLVRTF